MRRIAVWSGPRNVSTALMRSFEARGDCAVVDEPLYAAYLARTGKDHPGRAAILASQPTSLTSAVEGLQTPGPVPLRFEKHMAHHWPIDADLSPFGEAIHVLLVRDPARVVASYAKVRDDPDPEDLGYDVLAHLANVLPVAAVIDGDALLDDPPGILTGLCEALGIAWTERMLTWPAGRRATDGVWAPHWYGRVEASTGFSSPTPAKPVPERLQPLVAALRPVYDRLIA